MSETDRYQQRPSERAAAKSRKWDRLKNWMAKSPSVWIWWDSKCHGGQKQKVSCFYYGYPARISFYYVSLHSQHTEGECCHSDLHQEVQQEVGNTWCRCKSRILQKKLLKFTKRCFILLVSLSSCGELPEQHSGHSKAITLHLLVHRDHVPLAV